ncbi:asparaginase [Rhizobium sp. PRIMUS64]|uniref:asparaginase n=1 Tax=Rhizobium sp. PRIMUS64 TaxID=2908925 RepID=UPI001FF3D5D5|nr:asparaginase [Rhizobium sp. PRIMUS64]MCJ9690548.1 asparaginase [Rhizobium sp. PRIMUS64]
MSDMEPTAIGATGGRVVVLATGGTIAQNGQRQATLGVEALLRSSGLDGVTEAHQILQLTSPNVRPSHWISIANAVLSAIERDDVDGVVVTHGTDTIEETALFVELTCPTEKPIVFTGAMRPAHSPESDGPENLRNAVALCRSPSARSKGVLVVFSGEVHAARDLTKRDSQKLSAFDSPNIGAVGTISFGQFDRDSALLPLPHFPTPSVLPEVHIIYGYAGQDASLAEFVKHAQYPGLVIAGTGSGSVPDNLLPLLAGMARDGVLIVRSSRTGAGRVDRNGEVDDDAAGFIAAGTLNPHKARVLLMLCLASGLNAAETQKMFEDCSTETPASSSIRG